METILEQQRSYHEERERTMDAMVKELLHKKTGICVPMSVEFEELAKLRENPAEDYTNEEGYGKYLDLHECYEKNYIRALLTYLKDFVNRTKPLLDQAQELAAAHQEFVKQWDAGTFPVSGTRAATIENVTRRAARAAGERRDDSGDESDASAAPDIDSDDDEVPYNPKNLPLGWDGKPIPYWLYKLHGLNISYTCEICGNYTYKGPKAFQRHFAEWRHAHGMRCLGIPNTAHFANVTQIEDALAPTLCRVETCARHEMSGTPQHGALRKRHPDRRRART
ncbi:Splicing factor 3A subunit 3 [Operophtera brumata]|uniref:Splicing factor 3A subunit 3 n=1 Tax=Operophtera brumata TaxID=104452 RepID=A0A0L7L9N4_OPEBR|nr:Splicing factor 3A subunit 3 [Operophtera brumata]